MDVETRVGYFHKEHQDYLRFLDEWEIGIELTASEDEKERLRGLDKLRGLQPELQALRAHCASEERNVEEPYRTYLNKGQIDELRAQHAELTKLLGDVSSELRFATIYQTEQARAAGRRVAEFTRHHIQFEEQLLEEVDRKLAQEAEEKLLLRYTQSPE